MNPDPFSALYTSNDQEETTPAARRTAFRRDPHGSLVSGQDSECRITRDERGVRKCGSRVRIEESLALEFASSLQLPVPAVHSVHSCSQRTEILMEFVDGECLEEAWMAMNAEQKKDVARQLRHIVADMRRAQARDRPRIGAFSGPVRDCRQFSDYVGGPFDCEAEFNTAFVLDFLAGTPSLIRSAVADALSTDSRIVFTHGDLTPRNIIVKEGRVQALLDWEYAGWYPEYWEYVKFFERPTDCKDWKEYAEVIFETKYPKDLLTFQALARWQKP
ncbi:hypothetical protein AC578_1914 [Pseudocercospora eumusae]|uniref:Aminoglycoside phosphotransferase domain-containing protein n=1 Tax=Pseudocercospora eumusae TaxID=321146 RepID=A0A139HDI5_9PEZI|nr:hypothetical protein AC578_1914 [Pseudocercospora eumusae]